MNPILTCKNSEQLITIQLSTETYAKYSASGKPARWALPEALYFAAVSVESWIVINCSLFLQVSIGFTEPITQQYTNLLSNSICRHKKNALLLRNVACQSLPIARAQLS